jgi:hypothetical protein
VRGHSDLDEAGLKLQRFMQLSPSDGMAPSLPRMESKPLGIKQARTAGICARGRREGRISFDHGDGSRHQRLGQMEGTSMDDPI